MPNETPNTPPNKPANGTRPAPPAAPRSGRPVSPTPQSLSRRRSERYDREQRQRRQILIVAAGVVILAVIVAIGGFYLSSVAPNIREFGRVYDQKVTSGDYYKFRKIQLYNQLSYYDRLAQLQGQESDQITQAKAALTKELRSIATDKIEGDRVTSLNAYMDDLLLMHDAAQAPYNISVSNNDLDRLARDEFVPGTATATLPPASATALANVTATVNSKATATEGVRATKTAVVDATESVKTQATATLQPGYTAAPTPTITPTLEPTATPGTPTPVPTSLPQAALEGTATANLNSVLKDLKKNTDVSDGEYKQFVVKPGEYRRQLQDKLKVALPKVGANVDAIDLYELKFGTEGEAKDAVTQIKAANGDAAKIKDIIAKLNDDKNSDQVSPAKENAGERGWLPSDGSAFATTEKEVEKAAKALAVGAVSDQIGTSDGWYVLWVAAKGQHALDDTTHKAMEDNAVTRWLEVARDKAKASTNYVVETAVVPATATTGPTPTVAPTTAPPPTATQKPVPGLPTKPTSPTAAAGTPGTASATTPGITTSPVASTVPAIPTQAGAITPSPAASPSAGTTP